MQSLPESVRPVGFENSSVFFVTGSNNSSENREFKFVVSVLVASGSSYFLFFVQNCSSDNGNSVGRCSVVACEFSVKLTYSAIQTHISVFFIHVMVSCSGFVA